METELGLEDGKAGHGGRCMDLADTKGFCRETGVDALAVAIGNAHGNYPVAPTPIL